MCEYWRITQCYGAPQQLVSLKQEEHTRYIRIVTSGADQSLDRVDTNSATLMNFYIDPILKWPLYSNTFCMIQSSNVIVFHIHIHILLHAYSIHIPHHKHTNTHINSTHTTHKFTAKRNLCFCLCMCYGNAMFKMVSGKLDKDLTYCKGVIKPNFTYTYVIINHT